MEVVRRDIRIWMMPLLHLYEAAKCAFSASNVQDGDYKKALKYIEELTLQLPGSTRKGLGPGESSLGVMLPQ